MTEVKEQTLDCALQLQGSMTVGQEAPLVCPVQGTLLTSTSVVKFQNADTSQPYAIAFLGAPVAQGESLKQTVTSYKVGSHDLTQIYLLVDGKKIHLSPLKVDVRSVLPAPPPGVPPGQEQQQQGQQQAPTPFPIYEPERVPAPWWWWALWIGFGAALLIFVVWQTVKWLKERKRIKELVPEKQLTPQEQFLARIRKLESQGLHQKGEFKAFALELTSITKSAIGGHLRFPAEDLTSEELLSTLERRYRVFYNTSGIGLKNLLADLDQIKFAKIETDSQKCMTLLDTALVIGRGLFGDSA